MPPLRREVTAAPLTAGDLVAASGSVLYGGYEGTATRTWPCPGSGGGVPDRSHAALHRRWRTALDAMVARCTPGTAPSTLRDAWLETGEALPPVLLAHGVGIGVEPPVVGGALGPDASDADPLRAGTTLVVQGYVWAEGVGGLPRLRHRAGDRRGARHAQPHARRPARRGGRALTTTATSPAPDEPRVRARRTEILGIAKELFARKGYASTSTRDIAEACGMLPGSLYSHFRSKGEILQLVLTPFYEQLVGEQHAAVADGGSGAAQLEAMVRRVLVLCAANPAEITILHYDWPSLGASGELEPLVVRGNASLDLWRSVIASGVADGSLRGDIDPEVATRVITSSIHGVLDRHRYDARPDLAQRARRRDARRRARRGSSSTASAPTAAPSAASGARGEAVHLGHRQPCHQERSRRSASRPESPTRTCSTTFEVPRRAVSCQHPSLREVERRRDEPRADVRVQVQRVGLDRRQLARKAPIAVDRRPSIVSGPSCEPEPRLLPQRPGPVRRRLGRRRGRTVHSTPSPMGRCSAA